MTRLHSFLRLLVIAVCAVLVLALPAAASAKRHHPPRDRNHDGIPDKWERKHRLSTKARGVAKKDNDRDGLNNRAEFRSRTNPRSADSDRDGVGDANEDPDRDSVDNGNEARERTHPRRADSDGDGKRDCDEDADSDRLNNGGEDEAGDDPIDPDSDDDGVKDGDERAGEITAWDGRTLTIRVFGGSEISGVVDEDTFIECGSDDSADEADEDEPLEPGEDPYWRARFREDAGDDSADDGDDGADSDEAGDDAGDDSGDDADDDSGDDESGDDDGSEDSDDSGEDDAGCAADVLKVGAVVSEASFEVTSEGTFFDSIEIAD